MWFPQPLRINTISIFETEKVNLGELQGKLEALEDYIQNVEVDDMKEI